MYNTNTEEKRVNVIKILGGGGIKYEQELKYLLYKLVQKYVFQLVESKRK